MSLSQNLGSDCSTSAYLAVLSIGKFGEPPECGFGVELISAPTGGITNDAYFVVTAAQPVIPLNQSSVTISVDWWGRECDAESGDCFDTKLGDGTVTISWS